MNKTLGLVEVKGLALAIQTVDLMSKSANVEILGLENTNGFGWTLIKVTGDVGSVNAAVEVGMHNAKEQNGLVSHKVIARMSEGLSVGLMESSAPVSDMQVTEKSEVNNNSTDKKVQVKAESVQVERTKTSRKNALETKTIAKTTSTRKASPKKPPPEKGGEA